MMGVVESLSERWRGSLAIMAVAAGTLGAFAAPAAGAGQWGITLTHVNAYGAQNGRDPYSRSAKTFTRDSYGNSYTITITNNGTEPTSGLVEVEDKLPAGMVLAGETIEVKKTSTGEEPQIEHGSEWEPGPESEGCKTSGTTSGPTSGEDGKIRGASVVKCSTSHVLFPGQSYSPITLHVYVLPQAAPPSTDVATLSNHASVSGGGLGPESTSEPEGQTTIMPAVPFGFASFTTTIEELEGFGEPSVENPLIKRQQAGGHPFSFTNDIVFNYSTGGQTALQGGSGGPKEVQVDLPPGLLGNLQNTEQCPLHSLGGTPCPPDTAVGYVKVSTGGQLKEGKPVIIPEVLANPEEESLLWNLAPAPGHVAALGFVIKKGIPFVLEGAVRSGGDFGVTIGDNATSNAPRPLEARVTTCENGALEVSVEVRVCKATREDTKPFLTNPTGCAGPAPVTGARANAWEEPSGFATIGAYANAPSGPYSEVNRPTHGEPVASSFVTGCDKLQFKPQLEFKPSVAASVASDRGTSQADEPTGLTLDLKMPQTNEAKALATPDLKKAEVTLPPGLTASPSAADGLQACTKRQFWPPENGPEPAEHREPAVPAECPLASQIGTVEVFTPLLSGAPTAQGTVKAGARSELSCSQGDWSGARKAVGAPEVTYAYEWLENGKPIAAGKEHEVAGEERGKAFQCQVTASSASGSSVAVSRAAVAERTQVELKEVEALRKEEKPTAPPLPPPRIAAPSGTPATGNMLTCETGAWSESPTFAYQVLRNGEPIPGTAGKEPPKYTLTPADEGKVIQCQVTGTNKLVVAGKSVETQVVADSAAVVVSPEPAPSPPLPGAPLHGEAFLGQPECSPCGAKDAEDGKLLPLFLQIQDPSAGVIVKLHGKTKADPATGQLKSVFENQPQQPFELLELKLKGGPRAILANPQKCGEAKTTTDLTPWSAPGLGGLSGSEPIPGTPDALPSSSFEVGAGEACPLTPPFNPSFNAGTTGPAATSAGAYTNFSTTFGREDREQYLSGATFHLPLGLVGRIAAVKQCGEAEVKAAEQNAGECPPESEVGSATAVAGPGPHPFTQHGRAYLTGPYNGGPFGLAVVTPAVAGPFNLGNVVVRAAIHVDSKTAAVTVVSDPLPQIVSGVPIRLRKVNVEVNRQGFMLNPTSCTPQQVSATLSGIQGTSAQVSSPFGITGCKTLPFTPTLTASTEAKTSKNNGASLTVRVTSGLGQANIAKTKVLLPIALPSRLSTLQKACLAAVFEANPASCPEGSVVGTATAHTPVLKNPLTGPAYLVSHGGAAFPDLVFALQGEGITLDLVGNTDIKNGITISTFNAVPDAPVNTFETVLPEGPHSALAAYGNLCTKSLLLPTTITGQNGAVIKQETKIAVTGCPPSVTITQAKLKGGALLMTVKLSAKGAVKISGKGLKTTVKRNLRAGSHQIRVPLTGTAAARRNHKKTTVHVSLTVGKQVVTKTTTVRL